MPKAAGLHVDAEQDAPVLRAFEAWVEIMDRAIGEVEAEQSLVRVSVKGHEQRSARLNVLAEATKQVVSIAQQLGRTPASRVRLGAEGDQGEPDDDELDLPELPKRVAAKA